MIFGMCGVLFRIVRKMVLDVPPHTFNLVMIHKGALSLQSEVPLFGIFKNLIFSSKCYFVKSCIFIRPIFIVLLLLSRN